VEAGYRPQFPPRVRKNFYLSRGPDASASALGKNSVSQPLLKFYFDVNLLPIGGSSRVKVNDGCFQAHGDIGMEMRRALKEYRRHFRGREQKPNPTGDERISARVRHPY